MDLIETNSDHWGVLFSPVNEKLVLKVLKPVCQGAEIMWERGHSHKGYFSSVMFYKDGLGKRGRAR